MPLNRSPFHSWLLCVTEDIHYKTGNWTVSVSKTEGSCCLCKIHGNRWCLVIGEVWGMLPGVWQGEWMWYVGVAQLCEREVVLGTCDRYSCMYTLNNGVPDLIICILPSLYCTTDTYFYCYYFYTSCLYWCWMRATENLEYDKGQVQSGLLHHTNLACCGAVSTHHMRLKKGQDHMLLLKVVSWLTLTVVKRNIEIRTCCAVVLSAIV